MGQWRFQVSSNARKGLLAKPPVIVALILCVFIWLGCIFYQFTKLCFDHYFPYEGKVVAIGHTWVDYVTYETTSWDHLIIETPKGGKIDRLVSLQNRILAGIKPGSQVIKRRGFKERVIVSDKR